MIELSDLIGIPYKDCGRDKKGYDCYGLVLEIYKRLNINLPDYIYNDTSEESKLKFYNKAINGIHTVELKYPKTYSLVLIEVNGEPTHIGVCIDGNNFIHCVYNIGVVIDKLIRWQHRIRGYYEVCNY